MGFALERRLVARGCRLIAGVDEAGRGPLAGPVVAAAVVFPPEWVFKGLPDVLVGIRDSKQLTARQRRRFYEVLISHPQVRWAYEIVGPETIDHLNILRATCLAIKGAIEKLGIAPDHVLVDGNRIPLNGVVYTPVVKGDQKSFTIAAASVIAKVIRDDLMLEYHRKWPEYGFDKHKGYGTPQHMAALAKYGPCPIHRTTFRPVRESAFQMCLF